MTNTQQTTRNNKHKINDKTQNNVDNITKQRHATKQTDHRQKQTQRRKTDTQQQTNTTTQKLQYNKRT